MPDHTANTEATWYKDAVIYQLHIKSFFDANNDGIGDFKGLLDKLDHIVDLGVTAVWLLPFFPSPRRDDGYDIADYYSVSEDYGTMADFRAFVDAAHERGLKVIIELVINHTSDQHPWFQAARKAPPGSPERDFYVWSDSDEKYDGTRIIFLDTEKSNWSWDDEAGAYFWHRFYSHQPDLNFDNPRVLDEVLRVMHHWLDTGVDGLRLDAIPYLIEREGTSNENLAETHDVLKTIRADLDAHYEGKMLLAEANMWPEDTQAYFGAGDECHMAFHFPLMPRMYMAVAREDRFPITDIMNQTPDIPDEAQWAIFLRNHDELTLEMVTDSERDYLWNTYAAEQRARINLGIRRRLAPLMDRDRRRIELMHALLLTMPGTPVLYYGDEIGMGDNIFLGDRDGVRTPMQWSPDRNGGFSKADPAALALPAIQDPLYGFSAVNVESAERDRHSLLNWLKRMLAVRRSHSVFGRGTQRFIKPRNRKILAYLREYEGEAVLCVANLAQTAQAVELDLAEFTGRTPVEMSGETVFPMIGNLPYLLTLPPHAFYWFRLAEDVEAPAWSSGAPALEAERHTFVLRPEIEDIFNAANRPLLEREILGDYISHRRWFGAKDEHIQSIHAANWVELDEDLLLTEVEIATDQRADSYLLPLGIAWEGDSQGPFAPNLALARARRGRHVGLLTDGFTLTEFPSTIAQGFADARVINQSDSEIRFEPTEAFDIAADAPAVWPAAEQSNSSLVLAEQAVLKLLRRVQPGIHPEAEMTHYLWRNDYPNVPPMLGEVRRIDADGDPTTLMLMQGYVRNQGDGWRWTLDDLQRTALDPAPLPDDGNPVRGYDRFADMLGQRLAEMHNVLAQPSENGDFDPVEMSGDDTRQLATRMRAQLSRALDCLDVEAFADAGRADAEYLIGNRDALLERISAVAAGAERVLAHRIHGDLHLGQMLVTGDDVMFIDFEGEPARSLAERRAKDIPLRDVAGVLRSFSYAGAAATRELPSLAGTEQERADDVFRRFETSAASAFVDAYSAHAHAFSAELLDLYLLEKAAYEIGYEASNRPDWLPIPLSGLAGAARRLLAHGGH